jgi:hypothetical protein
MGDVVEFRPRVTRQQPGEINYQLVHCEGCGHDCTHHGRVEVYNRTQEDAPIGLAITIDGQSTMERRGTSGADGNPSSRRNGLRIVLSCEDCEAVTALEIVQHKGGTFISSRLMP